MWQHELQGACSYTRRPPSTGNICPYDARESSSHLITSDQIGVTGFTCTACDPPPHLLIPPPGFETRPLSLQCRFARRHGRVYRSRVEPLSLPSSLLRRIRSAAATDSSRCPEMPARWPRRDDLRGIAGQGALPVWASEEHTALRSVGPRRSHLQEREKPCFLLHLFRNTGSCRYSTENTQKRD